MKKICCFTGHRPNKLPWGYNEKNIICLKFKEILLNKIEKSIQNGYSLFISGMALGVDQIACECIIELKKKYKKIKLIACIPFRNQEAKWNIKAKIKYHQLLNKCDIIKILSEKYSVNCLQKRNEYMVNHSSLIIAVWNGQKSGTENTLKYAINQRKNVLIINTEQLKKCGNSEPKKDCINTDDKYTKYFNNFA